MRTRHHLSETLRTPRRRSVRSAAIGIAIAHPQRFENRPGTTHQHSRGHREVGHQVCALAERRTLPMPTFLVIAPPGFFKWVLGGDVLNARSIVNQVQLRPLPGHRSANCRCSWSRSTRLAASTSPATYFNCSSTTTWETLATVRPEPSMKLSNRAPALKD